MTAFNLADFQSLSVPERLSLIEVVWESLEEEQEHLPLSDEQRALLDERIAEMEANPGGGLTLEQLMAKYGRKV